jgi:hypothetical protein
VGLGHNLWSLLGNDEEHITKQIYSGCKFRCASFAADYLRCYAARSMTDYPLVLCSISHINSKVCKPRQRWGAEMIFVHVYGDYRFAQ